MKYSQANLQAMRFISYRAFMCTSIFRIKKMEPNVVLHDWDLATIGTGNTRASKNTWLATLRKRILSVN